MQTTTSPQNHQNNQQSPKPAKKKHIDTRRLIYALLAVLMLAFVGWFIYQKLSPTPVAPEYLTSTVSRGNIENSVMASGKIKAISTVDVGAQVSGEITRLYVDVGDTVKQGDLIAQISQVQQRNVVSNAEATLTQAQSALIQAEANAAQARGDLTSRQADIESAAATMSTREAELHQAETSFNRLKGLLDIDAVSREEYDTAKSKVDVARAALRSAKASHSSAIASAKNAIAAINSQKAAINSQKAAIAKAQNDKATAAEGLSYTTIRAPMDGTVVSVTQKQGTTVNANQAAPTIVTLADLSRVRINAQISEADVINIRPMMPVKFNIIGAPDTQYDAVLNGIEPAPKGGSSSTDSAVYYVGYLDVDNSDGKFRIGMTAQVNIIIDAVRDIITIPSSAITKKDGKASVQVLGEDGFAKAVPVTVGLDNRINAEIKSGLKAGDTIVISEASAGGGSDAKSGGNRNRRPML